MTEVAALEAYAGQLSEAASKSTMLVEMQHQYIHENDQTDVLTESGPVPSLAKQARLGQEQVASALEDVAVQMAGAMVYEEKVSGLAGTVNGGYFSVVAEGSEEYLILYKNQAGVAVEVKRYPAADALLAMRGLINYESESAAPAWELTDANRFTLLKILLDGTLDMAGSQISSTGEGLELSDPNGFMLARLGARESNINGLVTQPLAEPGLEFVDEHNFVLARLGGDGAFFGLPPTSPDVTALPMPATLDQQQRTDHNQILGYGQSLSEGQNGKPAISLVQPYSNLMLAGGVRIRPGESGYNPTAYAPLVESDYGTRGECPVSATCNGIVRRAVGDGELSTNWVMLGAACGRGGRSVEQLYPAPLGEGYYEKMVQIVKDCAALSKSQNKTYSVWAYTWDQGETNYIGNWTHSAYQYMQYQLEIFDTLTRQVVEITGQRFRPYLFTYQVGAHRKYSVDDMSIALAQWRSSRQRPDVVLATPVYIMPTSADLLHLTNEGYWLLGEYRSRAIYETMIRRSGKWRPLEPVSVAWSAEHIDIKFHVPRGELVLDTALAAAVPNFGFDVREAGSVVTDLITSVAVTAPDTVRLTLARPAATNAVVSYARGRPGDPQASGPVSGARGNLRDTHGLFDTAVSPLGNTFALHNACVMFQYDRKTGF